MKNARLRKAANRLIPRFTLIRETMIKTALAAVSALTLFLASPAHAQSAAPAAVRDATIHRHLGFLVRPYIGFGYLSGSSDGVTISGLSGQLGVVVGGALQENLILGGELWATAVNEPNVSQGGFSGTAPDTTFGDVGIGPNLTYYFMPANVYVSVTPALTRASSKVQGTDYHSKWGLGGRAAFGKEWWVSDHWGLGAAAQFTYSSNENDAAARINTWGAGVVFSATYN